MKKVLLALPIFLLFLAPVLADTDLTTNGCLIDASNTRFFLSSDFSCTIGATATPFQNVTIDMQGHTLTGGLALDQWNFNGLEVKNGNITGHVALTRNFQANKISIHDVGFSTTDFAVEIYPHASLATSTDLISISNVSVTSSGNILITTGQLQVENSVFDCTAAGAVNTGDNLASGTASGIQTYQNVVVTGCTTNSYDQSGILPTIIILQNTSFPIDEANSFSQGGNTIIHEEPLYLTARDQNNAKINAMATVHKTGGNNNLVSGNWNPTEDTTIGLDGGDAVAYIAKNITSYGGHSAYPTYNVTVKSRNQVSSKLVTFNSPADANFTLDFSGEDTGNNTVVDTRTLPEKAGNAVGGLISILAPFAIFLTPLLAVL